MLNPRNTPEKKILGPPTYSREKPLDPRNTHEKKNLEPTKYSREKDSDSQNTHEKNVGTHILAHLFLYW